MKISGKLRANLNLSMQSSNRTYAFSGVQTYSGCLISESSAPTSDLSTVLFPTSLLPLPDSCYLIVNFATIQLILAHNIYLVRVTIQPMPVQPVQPPQRKE